MTYWKDISYKIDGTIKLIALVFNLKRPQRQAIGDDVPHLARPFWSDLIPCPKREGWWVLLWPSNVRKRMVCSWRRHSFYEQKFGAEKNVLIKQYHWKLDPVGKIMLSKSIYSKGFIYIALNHFMKLNSKRTCMFIVSM